ncbi:hypothetical protein M422DRAFT_24059 [Sphaerobolus stellatus SS14]|nr:hypothetical protein M422DRAFT_24059 [Sphaerobolus stellatus SS14]
MAGVSAPSADGFDLTEEPRQPIDPRVDELQSAFGGHEEKSSEHDGKSEKDEEYTVTASIHDGSKPIYVEFTEGDPRNPVNKSYLHKWTITVLAVGATVLAASSGSNIGLGVPSMLRDLNTTEELAALALGIYCLGFGVCPLVTASLSEEFGRKPLFIVSSLVFTLAHLMIALAPNIATVIIGRLIAGAAGSTGATMVGGVVADIWGPAERGLPMSLFALAALSCTGLGAVFGGLIEQNPHLQWRWIQWVQVIISGAYTVVCYFVMDETRGGVILTREARKLRKESGDPRYRSRVEDEIGSMRELIYTSCTRPLYLLVTEPLVASFSLWIGVAWGILYSQIESVPLIFETLHGFNSAQVGLAFVPMALGGLVGFICNFYQERLYARNVGRIGPEARLYSSLVAAVLYPVGCFIYAWTALPSISSWVGPMVGIFVFTTALFIIYLAVFSYLADSYSIYASSALAGQSLCRNMMGFIFPLFTTDMYNRLTFRWASTLFGCLAAVLSVVPFILFWYGPQIRARSHFARKLEKQEKELQARINSEKEDVHV